MNKYKIEPKNFDNARISLSNENDAVSLIIEGDIDMRDTSINFLPYLLMVHETLVKNKIKSIKLNLLNLTFMNSNGIKSLINWIMKMTELPESERYKINISANTEIAWQESTLPVLQKLFPDYISIVTE
ncbi:MAG TPA: hypothetical protein P5120_08785 [Spirochaetota bacterium]|nr:hypothetical protein [Spirochaetota bacterium]HPF07895.1 hypothetical protein [Spirochaetota bacterium]HPR36976.1 hypothetical protein [Spirochaetota bacterium]HRX47602.1 hypothetical protein [Spirochaetota bacterium]